MSIDFGNDIFDDSLVSTTFQPEDNGELSLRPHTLKEYIGQGKAKENLSIFIEAARRRTESLDHVLLHGPPGLGKTTLAGIIRMVDEERLAVAKAYGLELDNFCTVLYNAGSTTKEAAEANDPYKACQESEANKFIKAPPSLDHRYMHEDIGSGLLPIAELGRLAGVPTPITDAHVTLSEAMMGRDYHAEGVNLEKMGLEGKTIEQVLDYVTRG